MIEITPELFLNESELQFTFVRSPGPGGQNVNKVATAVQLRFNVIRSTLPEIIRERLLIILGNKLTQDGDLIIKANRFRSQNRNKEDAINRLVQLIRQASFVPKKRKKTKPTYSSTQRRLATKKMHGQKKSARKNFPKHDQ